ncbi:hypothetical protein [Neorhizobium lilium]|nr:hypothetical protein [Neorhizobium lilium]
MGCYRLACHCKLAAHRHFLSHLRIVAKELQLHRGADRIEVAPQDTA